MKHDHTLMIWKLNAFLFLLMLFSVSFFNRLAEDDYLFIETVKKQGIVHATLAHYHSWNTRWLSIAWLNMWYWLIDRGLPLFAFNWMGFLFMLFSFYQVLKTLHLFNSRNNFFLFSILFCAAFFFSTFNKPDSWMWINSNTMYLWNIGFFCLVCSRILKIKITRISIFILALSGIYIGAASEPFAFTLLVVLPLIIFLPSNIHSIHFSRYAIIISWSAILFSFIIAYSGSGHVMRSNFLPHVGLMYAITRSFYFTLKILIYHFPVHSIPLILFASAWMYAGWTSNYFYTNNLFMLLAKCIVVILFLTYINTLPLVYLMGDAGPSRAWTPVSFYISAIACYFFYTTGQQLKLKGAQVKSFLSVSAIVTSLFLVVAGMHHLIIAHHYATEYDQQRNFEALPESGWLHSAKAGGTGAQ